MLMQTKITSQQDHTRICTTYQKTKNCNICSVPSYHVATPRPVCAPTAKAMLTGCQAQTLQLNEPTARLPDADHK